VGCYVLSTHVWWRAGVGQHGERSEVPGNEEIFAAASVVTFVHLNIHQTDAYYKLPWSREGLGTVLKIRFRSLSLSASRSSIRWSGGGKDDGLSGAGSQFNIVSTFAFDNQQSAPGCSFRTSLINSM
jgi:hypothetical protein